ncbi:MAG: TonB-dependent receptor [Burkholderiales bacterium]|nr:TonB-dependent receptor [Burkholderiales bacterium]
MLTPSQRDLSIACRRLVLAAALSAAFSSISFAQANEQSLPPLVVSTSRFTGDPAFSPIGATVITADDIRQAGAGNANEAIRRIGGVYARFNLNGTQDYSLDLRGFGSFADQNTVVMIDGIRLSQNEQIPALLSSIPIESIERIEILRGGGSVLYGEGATGGIIHIITKRAEANVLRGTLVGEVGSYNTRELRASVAKGWEGFSFDADASAQRTDNYRDNNAVRQDDINAAAQWFSTEGRFGLRVNSGRQTSRLPGSLTWAQFQSNPRQATTPNDFGSLDSDRVTAFAERRMDAFDFAAELSHQEKVSRSFYAAFGGYNANVNSRVTQFSPRLRHLSTGADWKNEFVAGLDFARWQRNTVASFGGFPSSNATASQKSRALYLRDEIRVGKARVSLGGRHEIFDKAFADPLGFGTTRYDQSHDLNAWELQGNYAAMPGMDVYAKFGQSYRVANVDDNSATPVPNLPLQPQISHDTELGVSYGNAQRKITFRVFRHELRNEIFFDPTKFANVNLDPTRREGFEVEGWLRLMSTLSFSAHLQHISAKFTEGSNAGREMVLVPRNTATLRLQWEPAKQHSVNLGLQWVDSQRYGGDFTNSCAVRIPAFTTLDARYAYQAGPWEFAIAGTNLTGKDYFTNAFGACQSAIYPDPGRQLKLSARFNF